MSDPDYTLSRTRHGGRAERKHAGDQVCPHRDATPDTYAAPFASGGVNVVIESGTALRRSRTPAIERGDVEATLFVAGKREARYRAEYIPKPWVEDFASFASRGPRGIHRRPVVNGTCTSESEANQQVLDDACARIARGDGGTWRAEAGSGSPQVTTTDVLQGGFIVDRFAQASRARRARSGGRRCSSMSPLRSS